MSEEFTLLSVEDYLRLQKNRVRRPALDRGAIYTALSRIETRYSLDKAVAFPVTLETAPHTADSQNNGSMAGVAIRMILLDEDYRPKVAQSYAVTMQDGTWETERLIQIDEPGSKPIDVGYLLAPSVGDTWLR